MAVAQLKKLLQIMLLAAFLLDMTEMIAGQGEQPAGNSDHSVNVNANLVTTDVAVIGKRTRDLRPEDFVLFDNGISQRITYFSRNEVPLAIAIIIDTSNSAALWMPMQRLAALTALSWLKPGDQAALFTFASDHRPYCKLTENKLLIAKEIGNIRSGGWRSNLRDALFDAANYLKENAPGLRRAIILISDDIDTSSRYSPKRCLTALLEADVTLYGIALPNEYWGIDNKLQMHLDEMRNSREAMLNRYKEELALIAKKTGGDNYSTAPLGKADYFIKEISLTRAETALEQAIPRLREQYTVGFNPSEPDGIGKSHRLAIEILNNRCPDCNAVIRSGYDAAKKADQLASPDIPQEKIQPAVTEDEALQQSMIAAAAAATGPTGRCDDIQFEASASVQTGGTGAQEMRVIVKIIAHTIQFETKDNQRIGKLRMGLFFVDKNGKIVGSSEKIIEVRRNAEDSDILYSAPIPFNPSLKQIIVVALDRTNDHIGSKTIMVSPWNR